MAIFNNSIIPAAAAAAAADDDVVTKSLRFNGGDSPILTRTPSSSGSQRIFTFSTWVKRSALSSTGYETIWASEASGSNYMILTYYQDGLRFQSHGGGETPTLQSNAVFRDVSAWYHIVLSVDTTQATDTNRVKIYVNGSAITFSSATYPTLDYDLQVNTSSFTNKIGYSSATSQYFDGYQAFIHFIDGTALDATSFAEEDSTTGQWKPKAFVGVYGTNGFHLEFADSTVSSTSFIDSSSNGLTVTANGDVAHSETQKKIGDSSIYGDGTGDYLSLNGESGLAFGTGDYTIEMWFRPASTASAIALYDGRATGNYYDATPYIFMASGGGIDAGYSDGSANHSITATGVFTADTWHHVALVRSSGTTRAYIDGDEVGTAQTDAATLTNPSSRPYIGQGGAAQSYDFSGYIDEIRVSSVARYTGTGSGAFTPSTTAFTSDSNTKLLIHSNYAGGIGADTSVDTYLTATGGTVTTDGDYKVHTFNSTGTFEATNASSAPIEYLVVAGGAGGGGNGGGGGGAGGYLTATGLSVTKQSYTVTVGAGGAKGAHSGATGHEGANGTDSTISTVTSTGGGGGSGTTSSGSSSNNLGHDGGSGGGGGPFGSGGSGVSGQGYGGGSGTDSGGFRFGGGGGGGASAAGGNSTNGGECGGCHGTGGVGGDGLSSSITGAAVTRGGGGGGVSGTSDNAPVSGGTGGGGDGGVYSTSDAATAGSANTGGGGGGGSDYSGGDSAAGGSGCVILRYKFQ